MANVNDNDLSRHRPSIKTTCTCVLDPEHATRVWHIAGAMSDGTGRSCNILHPLAVTQCSEAASAAESSCNIAN